MNFTGVASDSLIERHHVTVAKGLRVALALQTVYLDIQFISLRIDGAKIPPAERRSFHITDPNRIFEFAPTFLR